MIQIKHDGIDYESIDVIRLIVLLVFWSFIAVNIYGTSINTQAISEHYKKEEQVHRIQVFKDDCVVQCGKVFKYDPTYESSTFPSSNKMCIDRCDEDAKTRTDDVWRQ